MYDDNAVLCVKQRHLVNTSLDFQTFKRQCVVSYFFSKYTGTASARRLSADVIFNYDVIARQCVFFSSVCVQCHQFLMISNIVNTSTVDSSYFCRVIAKNFGSCSLAVIKSRTAPTVEKPGVNVFRISRQGATAGHQQLAYTVVLGQRVWNCPCGKINTQLSRA